MKTNRVSIFRVISVDVIAGVCGMVIFCIVLLFVLHIAGLLTKTENSDKNMMIFLANTPLYVLPIAWRVWRVNNLLKHGVEHNGVIKKMVSAFNPAEGIWYEYSVDGQSYEKYYPALYYKAKIKTGDSIIVVADTNNPKRSIIKNLFV